MSLDGLETRGDLERFIRSVNDRYTASSAGAGAGVGLPLGGLDLYENFDAIDEWALWSGSAATLVADGQLHSTDISLHKLRNPLAVTDFKSVLKVRLAALTGFNGLWVSIGKYLDTQNQLIPAIWGSAGPPQTFQVGLWKMDGGVVSQVPGAVVTLAAVAGVDYYFTFRQAGNKVRVMIHDGDPRVGIAASAVADTTITLAAPNIAKYGAGVAGQLGFEFQPNSTGMIVDDLAAVVTGGNLALNANF